MNPYDDNLKKIIHNNIPDPSTLSDVEARFVKRHQREKRKTAVANGSLMSVMTIILLVITLNTNTALAESLRRLPVLGEIYNLTSLTEKTADIERLGIVSRNNEHEVYLQYALSDDQKVLLYFQFPEYVRLESDDMLEIEILEVTDLKTKKSILPYFINPIAAFEGAFEHQYIGLYGRFPVNTEEDFPSEIRMKLNAKIIRRTIEQNTGNAFNSGIEIKVDSVEDLGIFEFEFELQQMMNTFVNKINKKLDFFGDQLELKSISRSPLSNNLLFKEMPGNEHRIRGIVGTIRNKETGEVLTDDLMTWYHDEKNMEFGTTSGITAEDNVKEIELEITGALMVRKDEEYVTIDLDTKTMDKTIEDLEVIRIIKSKDLTQITFKVSLPEDSDGTAYSVFEGQYQNENGDTKILPGPSFGGSGDYFILTYNFKEEIHGKIILKQLGRFDKARLFEEPYRITIEVPDAFKPFEHEN